jgi:asparagine synthetase B (glutamine-hydrolysing)
MCGIAGIIVFGEKGMPLTNKIKGMCKSMAKRGPDDECYLLVDAEGGKLSIWAGDTIHRPASGRLRTVV